MSHDTGKSVTVCNLSTDTNEDHIRKLFAPLKPKQIKLFTLNKYCMALVVFMTQADANAVMAKQHTILLGRRIRLAKVTAKPLSAIPAGTLVVVLDDAVSEEELFGRLVTAKIDVISVLVFHPLGYLQLRSAENEETELERLKDAGFKAFRVATNDHNQHIQILRTATSFFRDRNRVQLLNIPTIWQQDVNMIKEYCTLDGVINHVNIYNDCARVFYKTEEQAANAAAILNGRLVEGKRIHALHLNFAQIPNYKTSVYITPLDNIVTEEIVYDHFKQFGEIDFVSRRNCMKEAIICFKTADSVRKAIDCTSFPAPSAADKNLTVEITVNLLDGPLVLRTPALKRKVINEKQEAEKRGGKGRGRGQRGCPNPKDALERTKVLLNVHRVIALNDLIESDAFGIEEKAKISEKILKLN